MTALEQAKHRLAEIADLAGALSVLGWDQATHLPERAFASRGHQLATLTETLHHRRTDPELGLYGRYCISKRLKEEGFDFTFPDLRSALENLYH